LASNPATCRAPEQNADPARQTESQNVDAGQILNAVAALPISTWEYPEDAAGGRHIGPSAADFNAAFGLGPSTPFIAPADIGGVALVSIQGLKSSFDAQSATTDSAIQGLKSTLNVSSAKANRAIKKIRKLQKQNRKLNRRLKRLEKAVFHK
jgi:hypothetical protein